MRARAWILVGLISTVAGTMWYRGRDVLMTEAEIRAAIPPELRFIPPTAQEAKAERALGDLNRDISLDSNLRSPWVVGEFARVVGKYEALAEHSGWVAHRIEKIAALGPGAADAEYGNAENPREVPWDAYRVLSLRCDLRLAANKPVAQDVRALAQLLRLNCLRRGGRGSLTRDFPDHLALQTIHRALDAKALPIADRKALLKILPTDEELIETQRDLIRYELETQVVHALRPVGAYAILNPKITSEDDYRRYIVGRLDVPATLKDQVEAARGAMASISAGKRDPRFSFAARERNETIGAVPWKKEGESGMTHRMREIAYRLRLAFHPNPRGVLATLGRLSWSPEAQEKSDRASFAVMRARLQIETGAKGALPRDPWDNRPIRYDAKRHVVWSVGADRADDGGQAKPSSIGLPDLVAQVR